MYAGSVLSWARGACYYFTQNLHDLGVAYYKVVLQSLGLASLRLRGFRHSSASSRFAYLLLNRRTL
jgi:hypothetical protein